jgi:glutamyl-tRNA reductase
MDICVTGLSHKRAPVELREKLAVDPAELPAALAELRGGLSASEVVVLSTCNRVEVYSAHDGEPPAPEAVAELLARRRGFPAADLVPALYRHRGPDAVRHLFRVASSLDSMVLGETQIIGQVKDAYLASKEAGGTGRVFNRLFQQALAVAKRIHTSTALGEKNTSVAAVAAKLAGKIFQDLASKHLLVLGAGETAELVVEAFRGRGTTAISVVNRTLEHARSLATKHGASAHPLEELPLLLPRSDVVLCCLRSDAPLLDAAKLRGPMAARREEPMFLVDLSVPRIVSPDVNGLENVYLYDVDDLQSIVQQNVVEREREVARAEPIVEEETKTFLKEVVPADVTALLTALRERVQVMGDDELKRTLARLNGISPEQQGEVSDLVRRLVNKFLHAPTESLRGAGLEGPSHTLIELVRKVFGIKQ